ncbi:hypothetical protein FVR03_12270 [Pontibacter qinzhouensis]|uniref:HD domain-containing protein n=1 Tax=Pontibacter qinzhouensis TaxID=2603253 RepID=A0A5C8K9D2_9BACT|nr:hypothetical protein [Pontibacter qinzhouensis]TXK45716.1 hypothetical protein FVR03_12270 [Pontibacter qinzhouensis]
MKPQIKYVLTLTMLLCLLHQVATAAAPKNEVRTAFKAIIKKYSKSDKIAKSLWQEVEANYTGKERHYHNLEHLDNFYSQLLKCKDQITDWETLVLAMVYHDVIYGSPDHRNEERSAELAVEHLRQVNYPEDKIAKCQELILATKSHALSNDQDTNLFNDADMSILGLERDIYKKYVQNVRLEYASSPQFDAGRKRVLNYFLGMDRIFKTDVFYKLYESSARENIKWELSTLPE